MATRYINHYHLYNDTFYIFLQLFHVPEVFAVEELDVVLCFVVSSTCGLLAVAERKGNIFGVRGKGREVVVMA